MLTTFAHSVNSTNSVELTCSSMGKALEGRMTTFIEFMKFITQMISMQCFPHPWSPDEWGIGFVHFSTSVNSLRWQSRGIPN